MPRAGVDNSPVSRYKMAVVNERSLLAAALVGLIAGLGRPLSAVPLSYRLVSTVEQSFGNLLPLDVDHDGVDELVTLDSAHVSLRDANMLQFNDQWAVGCITAGSVLGVADLDRDSLPEVLIGFVERDTARVSVWNPRTNQPVVAALGLVLARAAGVGSRRPVPLQPQTLGAVDVDRDGQPEALLTGELRGPGVAVRGVWAFDLKHGRELWHFSTGTIPGIFAVTDCDGDATDEILLSGYAISNGWSANDIGDDSSWVLCLAPDGRLRWKMSLGGTFSNAVVRLLDTDGDGRRELVVLERGGLPNRSTPARLLVLDIRDGTVKASAGNPRGYEGLVVADLDRDGHVEIVAGGMDDTVRIYDRSLRLVRKRGFPSRVAVLDTLVLERGRKLLLGMSGRGSIVLLSPGLELLAEEYLAGPDDPYMARAIVTRQGPRVLAGCYPRPGSMVRTYSQMTIEPVPRTMPVWLFVVVVSGLVVLGAGLVVVLSSTYRSELNSTIRGLVRGAAVVHLTSGGRVRSLNRAATDLLGPGVRARGLGFADLCASQGLTGLGSFIGDGLKAGEPGLSSELTVSNPGSGTERNILARLVRVRRGFLVTVEDVSAVEYLRRIEAWVPVARSLAHRIKSPLTTMKLLVRQIESRHGGQDPATAEDAGAMKEEIDRLSKMTDGFMRMLRFDPPRRSPVEFRLILDKALGRLPVLRQSGITVVQDVGVGLPAVLVDEDQLSIAVANVVENAVTAMSGKGTLSIRAAAAPGGKHVELQVTDTGVGMSEECRNRVFEPYYTTKRGGTGLGMAITRKIVEENGGEIIVESEVGRGTTVLFRLPSSAKSKA